MKTLLVPIDFSSNALDAAQYALSSSSQLDVRKVILYHSNMEKSKPEELILNDLEKIREQLSGKDDVEVMCTVNSSTLTEGIADLVREHHVSLIVMGITGRNKVGQKLIGSQAFQISQSADVPILLIPAKAVFKTIENVALALPIIRNLTSLIPQDDIKTFVTALGAKLMIVNVSRHKDKTPKPVLYAGLNDIFGMFDKLDPSYHFLTANNTANSVADFARDNKAQLLISVSGKYGFLQGMFKSSVTKQLAYRAAVPLLIYRSRTVD